MIPTGWSARDGLRLAIHDAGGAGAPFLFQHGLCGDARQTAEAYPRTDAWRRITLECRGHGASEIGARKLDFEVMTDDLAAATEGVEAPFVAGGISMGAALALRLALARPERVRALVLVRPAWGPGRAGANLAPNVEVGELLARLPAADARAAFAKSATARRLEATSPDNLASLSGFFDRKPQDDTARLLREMGSADLGATAADLARLRAPALVCGSRDDEIHPLGLARELAAAIPGAHFVELPPKGSGRTAHMDALRAAIAAFLGEI